MKKLSILLLTIIFLSGCGQKEKETIYVTCKKDDIQPKYTASFSTVIKTTDNETISSLDISALYNATYTDTDMTMINSNIKDLSQFYKDNYKDVISETGEQKGQSFLNITIPTNEKNVEIFQKELPDVVKDGKILITKYRNFLSTQGYVCS